jgi:hypothetical protein
MRFRILATAGVTGLLLGAAFDPTPAAAQQQAVVVADSSFMQMAGSLGLLQATSRSSGMRWSWLPTPGWRRFDPW